jgi:hypothetical protein
LHSSGMSFSAQGPVSPNPLNRYNVFAAAGRLAQRFGAIRRAALQRRTSASEGVPAAPIHCRV